MRTPRVFIPQITERYDSTLDRRVPVFDFTTAAAFGTITPILAPEDDPMFLASHVEKIHDALETFGPDDYFLAVGDPSVMAICAGIIMRGQDNLKMLKWDKQMTRYITVEVVL
jgi:hypothetical protein